MSVEKSCMVIEVDDFMTNYTLVVDILNVLIDLGYFHKEDVMLSADVNDDTCIIRIYDVTLDTATFVGEIFENAFGEKVQWLHYETSEEDDEE